MKDLTDARWIKLKGILFLLIGVLSATLIVLEHPTLKMGVLLAITIWCFCRFYYFAFYVIEKYVDPGYRFSGLWSFACYFLRGRVNAETQRTQRGESRTDASEFSRWRRTETLAMLARRSRKVRGVFLW